MTPFCPHLFGSVLRRAAWGASALAAMAASSSALAQGFPSQPVRILVGLPAGSMIDVATRTLAEGMAPLLGQAVVVENRPGAGGTLATSPVAAAAPDGHLLNASGCSGDAITHAFTSQGRTPLVPFKDLTPVARLMRDHWLVLVPGSSKVDSLSGLAEEAGARGEALPFPSQGEGSVPHLQGERLAKALGFKALHVPYKDSSVNDLVAGRLSYAVLTAGPLTPLVKSGKLKALAVLSSERLPALPDVPTANESGLPGYQFNGGICLYAPGGTPRATLQRLNQAVAESARQTAVRDKFASLGLDTTPWTKPSATCGPSPPRWTGFARRCCPLHPGEVEEGGADRWVALVKPVRLGLQALDRKLPPNTS